MDKARRAGSGRVGDGANSLSASRKAPAVTRRESHTIAFRVDPVILSALEKGAAPYGISVHEYARQRLLELLERQEEARLIADVADVKQDVAKLREDIAVTLGVVLTNLTAADPAEIATWIDENLRAPEQ